MNNLQRLIWCALLIGIQSLYFPLNRLLHGVLKFKTVFDDYVLLWPGWVLRYGVICVWWIAAYLWAAWHMEDHLYEEFFIALAVHPCRV